MRKRAVAIALIVTLPALSRADSSQCSLIKEPDRRHFCYAVTKGDPSWCSFIKEQDLRHECYALVDRKRR